MPLGWPKGIGGSSLGRRKKNESSVLVKIVNDFYAREAGCDPNKLKYNRLAQYAAERGIQAKWYDFQRDKAVMQQIRYLKEEHEAGKPLPIVPAYKTLDIDNLIKNCCSPADLRQKLYELDCYWKNIYGSAVSIMDRYREMTDERMKYEQLKQDVVMLEQTIADLKSQNKRLSQEAVYLRRAIRDTLYPAIANKLLRESNLPIEENPTIRPDAFSGLVEGELPQPFDGIQAPHSEESSRQERLLEVMRKQINGNDK